MQELGKIIAKNMAKTARRQLGRRHLLFGEYLRSWTNTIEDELNVDAGKHVLATFLNSELFWINNKAIILMNSSFAGYKELSRSWRVLSTLAEHPRRSA